MKTTSRGSAGREANSVLPAAAVGKKCNVCNVNITKARSPGIQCHGNCGNYYHTKCANLPQDKLNKLRDDTFLWQCDTCKRGSNRRSSINFACPSDTATARTDPPARPQATQPTSSKSVSPGCSCATSIESLRREIAELKTVISGLIGLVQGLPSPLTTTVVDGPSTSSSQSGRFASLPSIALSSSLGDSSSSLMESPEIGTLIESPETGMLTEVLRASGSEARSSGTPIVSPSVPHVIGVRNPVQSAFVSRLHPETTEDNIKSYINNKTGINADLILCTRLVKKDARISDLDYISFKVQCKHSDFSKVFVGEFWPDNVLVRPFTSYERNFRSRHHRLAHQ